MMRHMIQKRSCGSNRIAFSSNCTKSLSAATASTDTDLTRRRPAECRPGSLRRFSTHMNTVPAPSNVMLSPFLARDRGDRIKTKHVEVDIAFMGLLKAMAVLKSTPADDHIMLKLGHAVEGRTRIFNSVEVNNFDKRVETTSEADLKSNAEPVQSTKDDMNIHPQIQKAMLSKRIADVVKILEKSMESPGNQLNDNMLGRVIHFLSFHDLRASFVALKYYVQRSNDLGKLVKLDTYRRVVQGIYHTRIEGEDLCVLAEDILHHIRDTFSEGKTVIYQHILLPALVAQLAKHRDLRVNMCAKPIFEYILMEDFPLLNPELYEAVLNEASLNRVGHSFLPYHRLLAELVSRGYKPKPSTIHNLLQSYYPYSDPNATYDILKAIKTLSTDSASQIQASSSNYRVDIGTLESISMATTGCTKLNLLVWDLAEMFEHEPTECMFEDVILSFGSVRSDDSCFKALLDMELSGYVPSYTLMRQVAFKLSSDHKRLKHARNLLAWNKDGQFLSPSAMNSLLLGFGMRKDIDTAFEVFEDFAKFNLQTDENTFSFLMESLWLSAKDKISSSSAHSPEDIDDILAVVDTVIGSMQLVGVGRSSNFIYEHMRLLCLLSKVDNAKVLLESAIADKIAVKTGSIVMIATEYVNRGDVETARCVANLSVAAGCGRAPLFLLNRINVPQQHGDK